MPLLRATVKGDVETIYLLNSSAQQSVQVDTVLESIQLGDLQTIAPAITWVIE